MTDLETLQYPIGRFNWQQPTDPANRAQWLDAIAATPRNLRKAVEGLAATQLDTRYREGGWTVRQVVHH
jgi:hypothetical protein